MAVKGELLLPEPTHSRGAELPGGARQGPVSGSQEQWKDALAHSSTSMQGTHVCVLPMVRAGHLAPGSWCSRHLRSASILLWGYGVGSGVTFVLNTAELN